MAFWCIISTLQTTLTSQNFPVTNASEKSWSTDVKCASFLIILEKFFILRGNASPGASFRGLKNVNVKDWSWTLHLMFRMREHELCYSQFQRKDDFTSRFTITKSECFLISEFDNSTRLLWLGYLQPWAVSSLLCVMRILKGLFTNFFSIVQISYFG